MEVVYQDLALAPHLNPVQNMFLGREISRKGRPRSAGVHGREDHAGEGEAELRRARRHGPRRCRRRSARCRAVSGSRWRSPGPSAGPTRSCSSTSRPRRWAWSRPQNVLESIKRVKAKGIAVILISHSMPHVLEVADRVQVLRLGRRVATFDASKTIGGAAGRRHDRRPGQERRSGMSVITPPEDVAVVDTHEGQPVPPEAPGQHPVRLDPRGPGRHRGVLLGRGRRQVPLRVELLADLPERRGLGGARRRHDVRHHHLRDRPVDRLGAGVLQRGRGQGHGGSRAAQGWGTASSASLVALVSGLALGRAQRHPGGQGQDPAADRHPRHAVGGSGARPGHHRRDRRAGGARGDDGLQHATSRSSASRRCPSSP